MVESSKLALCVNPMSGRDVRRLAARATNMTHEAKRDIVARVAAGADAVGVTDIYITAEPFRIASLALENMNLRAKVHCLKLPIRNDARDTEANVAAFLEAGCTSMVSLGGDGTNRAIVRALGADCERVHLMPLSTGTNNVFPVLVEPTIAGMVAGMQARGLLVNGPDVLQQRAKVLHVSDGDGSSIRDVGLIDAVLLRQDHVGNLLPFDAQKIERMLLTRAEPDGIGMSPIGGLLQEVSASDDAGLMVDLEPITAEQTSQILGQFLAPLSPGLFAPVAVRHIAQVALGDSVSFAGPGVLALDGDRDHKIVAGRQLQVCIRRDGPWVLNAQPIMRWAVAQGMMQGVLAP
jgi:hypothetical protein